MDQAGKHKRGDGGRGRQGSEGGGEWAADHFTHRTKRTAALLYHRNVNFYTTYILYIGNLDLLEDDFSLF